MQELVNSPNPPLCVISIDVALSLVPNLYFSERSPQNLSTRSFMLSLFYAVITPLGTPATDNYAPSTAVISSVSM